ncbi:MAG: hypothetical protein GTN60_07175, partial [Pseudomonas stutzeri]|nr:hypothetical protein [Stutzerimonas stutzeri]NIM69613.1 hypothetical protein [Xanthomonadales bacterium]NIN81196.1 hypothetical protein [Stutzerimonas stutzeri]NIO13929.1 hypothetical protein [Xanthomonadales bacterium]NIP00445.1 hypothetical protein [Stutzerimonas stutzeri]
IARATALTLLRAPLDRDDMQAINAGLRDPDPLVRIGSVRAMRGWPADWLAQLAGQLLSDPVRGVRTEAVSTLAPARNSLPSQLA